MPDSYHAITPARVDICPLILSIEEKQSAQEFQLFFSSVNMEGNQTRFNECSDSDIKKLVATDIPESTKKSTKYAVNRYEGKNVTSTQTWNLVLSKSKPSHLIT